MNPIIQAMSAKQPMLAQARKMVQTIKTCGDPNAMISQMVSSNPQINQIINQYGGDPKTAFYKYAEANGVNPDDILQMMK